MNSRQQSPSLDLSSIQRIVVLPLGFGRAAPNRRAARWNGKEVRPTTFSTEEALMWESLARFFAFREPFARGMSWIATFLQFGMHISGRHLGARVWLIDEARYDDAVEVAEALMSKDGGHASTGVGEWSPALVTLAGSTQLALHIGCLDDSTETELTRRLTERAGLVTSLSFSRHTYETVRLNVNGLSLEGAWNPLRAKDQEESTVFGVATPVKVGDLDLRFSIRPRT
jgi:hypothetical protein